MRFRLFSFQPKTARISLLALLAASLAAPSLLAQNAIQLFGPVNVRLSTVGTGNGADGINFNSATLNLSCSTSPITAVLSSTADGTGNLLVDNFVNVTVIAGSTTTGPTNACERGLPNPLPPPEMPSCFSSGYQVPASTGALTGQDPDNLVATGGVAPIDISQLLVPGLQQVQIALEDVGSGPDFFLASSTLYLNTNCTQNGVTGPALVTGNPISGSAPTPDQLSQDFSFNPSTGQQIGFEYDLTAANSANSLTVTDGTIPQVNDNPIDPSTFQSIYVPQTSFATSNCLVHSGELLPSGLPACKLFTLECKIGNGASASGAQCPTSTQSNEIFNDVFNGPGFTLSDIPTPGGPTFHEGIGFLMASEGWGGGPCTYEAAANLAYLPCPQNLLTSFTSSTVASNNMRSGRLKTPTAVEGVNGASDSALTSRPRAAASSASSSGTYTSSGRTTHPNSTFITVAQVPEDLTTVTLAGQNSGWIKTSTANFTLSSQPPVLSGTTLPGAASFVASPIQSITYGISPVGSVPIPGDPISTDTVLSNSITCPTLASPTGVPAAVFTPSQQTLTGLADGQYVLHYYAEDCAGTEELQFNQDSSGNWTTGFYTYPINVDTTAPVVTGPTLPAPSAQGTYTVNQSVLASFSCTDSLSGVAQCGGQATGGVNSTGTLTSLVDTSSPGLKTFTVQAVDVAGNTSSASVQYTVVSQYDNQVQFSINPQTVSYPQGANVVVQIVPGATSNLVSRRAYSKPYTPSGTVKILDGSTLLDTIRVQGNGAAYDYIHGLSAGQHNLSATYSGDGTTPGGTSAPVLFTVKPAPVTLGVFCWNSTFPYGADYNCGAYTGSAAGPAQGVITYKYDNGAPVTVSLQWGVALFTIKKPPVGSHSVVVSYAAQTNYAAATPQTQNFTVTPAPVNVGLTPSSWYLTGGSLTLTASVQSWSAGPPKSTGSVTFSDGSQVLGVFPVDALGHASISVAASALTNGNHTFTAAYAGGTNYGTGQTSISVKVAHN